MLYIYIHGFNSSPHSFKAQYFFKFLSKNHPMDEFIAPKLSEQPSKAIHTLSQCIEKQLAATKIALIGSSLGGFYATWLAQTYHLKAVLINPAVNPQELLMDYLGKNINYHTGEKYEFTARHIEQLNVLTVHELTTPKKIYVMLQEGDEVLDYRLAKAKYSEATLLIEPGGDHSFQYFEQHCENIVQFLRND